jgi:hypothetical protein
MKTGFFMSHNKPCLLGTVSINGLTSAGVVHNDSSGNLSTSLIVNADVDAAAAIVDTKLATISTAGKVANSATTATASNTANAIVLRDSSGNTTIGTLTAATGVTVSTFGAGVVTSNSSGVLNSNATTNHAVQIGNAGNTLTSLTVGTNGQVLIGATGADPKFASLTSTGGTISYTLRRA